MMKNMNKTFDLDSIFNINRPFSWSAISSFEWNKEQFWKKYIGKEIMEVTPELEFGSMIDKKIQDEPSFMPELHRFHNMQFKMLCEFNGIPLIGIADTYGEPVPRAALADHKTGRKAWDQKRADETGQLTMYCLMLWQIYKIKPEDIDLYIDWMPTRYLDKKIAFTDPIEVLSFRTKRSMHQVLTFGQRILDTYIQMQDYCHKRPVLDTHDAADFFGASYPQVRNKVSLTKIRRTLR